MKTIIMAGYLAGIVSIVMYGVIKYFGNAND